GFNQRVLWITVGVAVLLLLLGIGLYFFRARQKQAVRAAEEAAVVRGIAHSQKRALPAAPTQAATEAEARPPEPDATPSWPNLDRFNEGVTIETFRKWAAALLASDDEHVITYLKERLAELIGADASRAGEVLGWVRAASPKEAGVYLSAIRNSEAVQLKEV